MFYVSKKAGKRLLPRVYIDTHEKFKHSSYWNMIKVTVQKLTKLFGRNSGPLLDISNIILKKNMEIGLAYSL